jgi:small neutral amino acid transporter SnatA (MarC family)
VTIESSTLLLFLVMDPLGNIPFFLASLKPVDPARQGRVIVRELLIAYGVMVVFLFAGHPLLGLLGISEPALTIAGGVVLFLIALRMVFPSPERSLSEGIQGEPFIVPLAIPYVARPSVLATELLLMSREPQRWGSWLIALSLAWAATAVILLLGSRLRSYLGPRGLIATERLMGMVLVAVAVQMFLSGVERYLGQLPRAAGAPAAHSAPLPRGWSASPAADESRTGWEVELTAVRRSSVLV